VSVGDVGRLVNAAGTVRNQTMIELLYATGCRVGELVRIRVEDIDQSRRTVRVAGKGKERTVFFGSRTARLLRKLLRGRRKGPLFLPELLRQTGCLHSHDGVWRLYWRDYSGGTIHAHKTSTYLGMNLTLQQAGCEQGSSCQNQSSFVHLNIDTYKLRPWQEYCAMRRCAPGSLGSHRT
jgi:hypothetical protein